MISKKRAVVLALVVTLALVGPSAGTAVADGADTDICLIEYSQGDTSTTDDVSTEGCTGDGGGSGDGGGP